MKKNIYIFGLMLIVFSCKQENIEIGQERRQTPACFVHTPITAPPGFQTEEVSDLDSFELNLHKFQFITDKIGYVLGSKDFSETVLLQTKDGGSTWTRFGLGSGVPYNFFFKNENEGFISLTDTFRWINNYKSIILKTKNGGKNWEKIEYPNLKGTLSQIQFDSIGHAYAMLDNFPNKTFVKSIDNGISWDTLFAHPYLNYDSNFRFLKDTVFISGKGTLFKISKTGNLLETITTGLTDDIKDFRVVDAHTIFAEYRPKGLLKSTNGGKNWTVLFDNNHRIIDFYSANKGFLIKTNSECVTDTYNGNDAISYTEDGGLTWQGGAETLNIIKNYASCQQMGFENYLFLIDRRLIRLKRN